MFKFSTHAVFGCSEQRSWTCSWPCGCEKNTYIKKEGDRGGGTGWVAVVEGRVYGLKVDALTKEASSTNGHKPWLSLLSFQCVDPFKEKLFKWPADKLIEALEFFPSVDRDHVLVDGKWLNGPLEESFIPAAWGFAQDLDTLNDMPTLHSRC